MGLEGKGDPNSRCNLMMKEATVLHTKIKTVAKDVNHFKSAAETALESIKQVLATPLPKIYEDDAAAAKALMNPNVETVAGEGFSGEAANKAKAEFAHKMAPRHLEAWMAKHDEALAKQKLLNKSYDDMVAMRNKVATAKSKEETLRRSGLGGEDAKVQEATRNVQLMQDKLNVANEKYTNDEAGQYTRLVALNTEAAGLGAAIRTRLGEAGEALLAVRDAVPDNEAPPMPATAVAQATPVAVAAA